MSIDAFDPLLNGYPANTQSNDIDPRGGIVVSVGGWKVLRSAGVPSTTGNWHNGDLAIDYVNHNTYSWKDGSGWVINT